MIGILFFLLFFLIIISVPISISLGFASLIFCIFDDVDTLIVVHRMIAGIDSFPLLALPFFILAGLIMGEAGSTRRIMNLANCLVGNIRGGLAAICVLSSCFFGFISGSGVADTAAVGTIMMPEMVKKGYGKDFTAMLQASAGVLGMIIPPSVALVIIGIAGEISIGKLLLAGIIPGWLTGFLLVFVAILISRKRGYAGAGIRSNLKDTLIALKGAILPLLTPVIILGGILSGIFTPTEAAVFGVVYAILLGILYKEIRFKALVQVFKKSAIMSSIIMFIISAAKPFGWIMAGYQFPQFIAQFFLSITDNPIIIMLSINFLLLLLGDFMETITIILILTPILLPLVVSIGFDPVHFGLIMGLNLAIGAITPPLGVTLMTTCNILKIDFPPRFADWWPLFGTMVFGLLLLIFFPCLALWLPNMIK